MDVIVIAFLLIFLVLAVKYFTQKIEKKDNEIKNLLSNLATLKARKDECQNELFVIQYTHEIKNNSIDSISRLEKYIPNKKIKVLIADYIKESATNTNSILESMGCETIIAPSGISALMEIEKSNDYDIIITNNIFKDRFNGTDLLAKIKENKKIILPVIVLTVSSDERKSFIEDIGFDEYMTKPLDANQVKKTFKKLIPTLSFKKIKKQ